MLKNKFTVFFGIFLVSMLFVPPSIPYMVPEAEAAVIVMITDGPNGGDCSDFGTWDAGIKTCTLTTGISLGDNTAIEIASDGITLDGAGYTMSSNDADQNSGVHVSGKSDIVIKNITLQGFVHGIEIVGGSSNITIESSTMTNNTYGLSCVDSTNLHLSNNVLFGNLNGSTNYSGCTFDTLLTDKKSYNYDETITVSGNSPDMIMVQLKLPGTGQTYSGNIINTSVDTDSAGNYQYQINLSQYAGQIVSAGTGDYLIIILFGSDTLGDIIDTITVHITVPSDVTNDTTLQVVTLPNQNFSTTNSTGVMFYDNWWIAFDGVDFSDNSGCYSWYTCNLKYDTANLRCDRNDGISSFNEVVLSSGGTYTVPNPAWAHYPVGTSTITCTGPDIETASFTVSVDYTPAPSTLTFSAYVNATSPTGRTISASGYDIDSFIEFSGTSNMTFSVTASKDNVPVAVNYNAQYPYPGYHSDYHWFILTHECGDTNCQLPIPNDWEAGTYDLSWIDLTSCPAAWNTNYCITQSSETSLIKGSSIVEVPALPSPPSTLAFSAYVNATSPTGRTISASGDDIDSFIEYYGNDVSFDVTISKDNVPVALHDNVSSYHWWIPAYVCGDTNCQIPIPNDWEAGTYDLSWANHLITGSSIVEVPALIVPGLSYIDTISFENNTVSPGGLTVITVLAHDIQDDPSLGEVRQTLEANVFSDSDPDGIDVILVETGIDTGVFVGAIYFILDNSEGSYLQVSVGDTVTAEYVDETLPEPYTASDNLTIDATVTVVDAFFDTTSPTVGVSNPRFVDAFGNLVDEVGIDQQVQIAADITNTLSVDQEFAYWIEYTGPTSNEMWITGYLTGGQSMSPALSWTPAVPGDYTFTIKLVDSIDDNNSLAAPLTLQINIPVPEILIPSWIKNNAGWWADEQISDDSFVGGLQWLITNGIMYIPPTEQGADSDNVIPGWIKNNAGWWADDLIDDRNFVTGLQWLITNGIMIIG